jgi:aspartate dehydrogenase
MIMKKIALIGCGALGTIVARGVTEQLSDSYQLTGVLDVFPEAAEKLAQAIHTKACRSLDELLADGPELVLEVAGIAAVKAHGVKVLNASRDLLIISIGSLADAGLKAQLEEAARANGRRIYLVNGALGGLDIMQTMAMMGPTKTAIVSSKAPKSLNGAPYLAGKELPADAETLAFSGNVTDAITGFPKNVNVAVAACLASQCPDIAVSIRSVPGLKENQHSVHLENALVTADITIRSRPDPENPKSSTSAAWSVIALLKNLASPVFIY